MKGIQDESDSGNKSAVGIPRETHLDSRKRHSEQGPWTPL